MSRGVIAELKALAENIIAAQEAEIADMKKWYLDWFSEDVPISEVYMAMRRELSGISGKELGIPLPLT